MIYRGLSDNICQSIVQEPFVFMISWLKYFNSSNQQIVNESRIYFFKPNYLFLIDQPIMQKESLIHQQTPKMTFSQRISQFEKQHSYTAYIYAIISNVCFVIMQINMKIATKYITPFHALSIRGFFLLFINTIVVHYHKIDFNIKEPSTFIIVFKRIFLSCFTVAMLLAPLKYIPAGTVNALFNTAPIIVCFVEAFKYNRPLNFKHFLLTLISFVGILLVIQPDFLFGKSNSDFQNYKYFLFFSLGSAFTNSFSMSYLHDLKGKVSSTVALHYFYIGQSLFNSFLMMFEVQNEEIREYDLKFYICIASLVIFAYFTQNFNTRAIMLKKPSYIMPLGYVTIILSSILDNVMFGSSFGTLSIIGMILTSSGLLVKLFIPDEEDIIQITKETDDNHKKELRYEEEESFSIDV